MTTQHTPPTALPSQDRVTDEWLRSGLAAVFAEAHRWLEPLQRETIDAIIAAAGIQPGMRVLDIASGSGIPALEIARRVGPAGHVTATDPAQVCVDAIADNARDAGLDNVDAVLASATALPFGDGSFDAVMCHMGAMFFPDLQAALTRIRRTVSPGARAAFAAWGPIEENTMIGTLSAVSARHLPPPFPIEGDPKDIPFPFRFAEPGTLTAELRAAGFEDVREEQPVMELIWPDTPESQRDFWLRMNEAGGPLEASVREALGADFVAELQPLTRDDGIHFTASIVIASGRAPA